MINSEVFANLPRLRRCRYTFRTCLCVAVLLAVLFLLFFLTLIRKSNLEIANTKTDFVLAMNAICFLTFLLAAFISIREDRLLDRLVLEVEMNGSELIVTTIFSNRFSLRQPTVSAGSPTWIRQRRIWPTYFLHGNDAIQYFRQASKIVKMLNINGDDLNFYWICTDTNAFDEYLTKEKEKK